MADDPNLGAELKTLATGLKTATDEVKAFAEKVTLEMKNLGAATTENKANADKALATMNELAARLTEVEQKTVRRGGGDGRPEMKSLGQLVIENETVKALMEKKNGQARITIDLKDITSAATTQGTGVSTTTSLVVPDRVPLVNQPMRKLVVRDLITPGTTLSQNIEYPVETDDP